MSTTDPRLLALIERAQRATLGRRQFVWRGAVGGAALAGAGVLGRRSSVAAQGEELVDPTASISRDAYWAEVSEVYELNPDAPQGGVFILGDNSDINTTNPIIANNSPTLDVIPLVFEYLVVSHATRPAYAPGLADSWEISEDGLTYTFHLAQNVTWHDGEAFNADDVIFSFDAQANPDTGSNYTASWNDAVASYEKVDDFTVRLTATQAFAPVVFMGNTVGSTPIVAEHIWGGTPFAEWDADGGSNGQDPSRIVGTGPFTFVEWIQGETTRLARNENYWQANAVPNIDEFIFQVWPDEATAVEALLAGDIDGLENVPPVDTQTVMDNETTEVEVFDTYNFTFYGYNMDPEKTPLFTDVKVRKALFYALDRDSILENIQLGYGTVAQGTQPTLSVAFAPDELTTRYDYNPELAMQLLDEAGWVDSDGDGVREKDGVKLEFEVMYTGGIRIYDQLAPYMQEAWAAVGAAMTPNPVDFGSVLIPAITETFDYQIAMLGFNWDLAGDQAPMFGTEYYMAGYNFMKYSNPEVDRLLSESNVELDPVRRRELLVQTQDLVNEDLPVGIFWFSRNRDGYNTRVKGWYPNAYGQPDLTWSMPFVYIEE
jgi:peptide/nickel transport system substrate-binding protein